VARYLDRRARLAASRRSSIMDFNSSQPAPSGDAMPNTGIVSACFSKNCRDG